MTNKGWPKITTLDAQLRRAFPCGMFTGTKVKIEMVNGFEMFNTRPYHNYETWSDGYRVTVYSQTDGQQVTKAEAEDLDDAVALAIKRAACEHDFSPLVRGGKPAILCKTCGHHPLWTDVREASV